MWKLPLAAKSRFWNPEILNTGGLILLLGLAVCGFQCNGSSGGSGSGSFDVVSFSATKQSPRVYLNDAIVIMFSEEVDAQTVQGGIYIYPSAQAGATRANGEWKVEGKKVTFTPRLPTDPNFSNGGFVPNTEYTICVPRPNDSCSVFIQNSPGLRSKGGRGVSLTRTESFLTVQIGGQGSAFRPEAVPTRPEIESMSVIDASNVTQALNPIYNLISGQTFNAGVLTKVTATPSTTMGVPNYNYTAFPLTKMVTSTINLTSNIISKNPLRVTLSSPSQPMATDEFKNAGGVLTIRDASVSPPLEASWAIDSNTTTDIVTLAGSGPDFDQVGFSAAGPFTAIVTQGITRQVAPGDVTQATAIQVNFSEAINPLAVALKNFTMYQVTDSINGLQYAAVAPASTLQGAGRQGITHTVVDSKSIVTLKPKSSFPQSKPGIPATIVVMVNTAQGDNYVAPGVKNDGARDLNNFPLAYPKRTGWVLGVDANQNVTTVAHIQSLGYTNNNPAPANVQVAWGFQTRADTTITNAIVENFVDTFNRGTDCQSSAAWTLGGLAGLYATFGYGGNAVDGDLTVSGAVELDSDTRQPGPDGIVEWNYNQLNITSSGTLTLKGRYPIRINALQNLTVAGLVDGSGANGLNAPGGTAINVGRITGGRGGPGGGAGGDSNTNPTSAVGAFPMQLRGGPGYPKAQRCGDLNKSENRTITINEPNCGGGTGGNRGAPSGIQLRSGCSGNGGAHAQNGMETDYLCANIGAFGRERGFKWIIPSGPTGVALPTAGTGGGAGGNAAFTTGNPSPANDVVAGSGGGAGGGVGFVCAGNLVIKSSATIQSNGGNGGTGYTTVVTNGTVSGGFGAGGAGGSVWFSGTSVTLEGNCTVTATGGTGNPSPSNPSRSGDGGDGYIIVRDRGSSPDIQSGAKLTPAQIGGRAGFAPATNGQSTAYSSWYDSGEANPKWAFDASNPSTGIVTQGKDLVWLNQPSQGQNAIIDFQGAPDQGGTANPDPTTWYPAGNTTQNPCAAWDTDISKLRTQGNLRHIRFRIRFTIGNRDKGVAAPNQIAIQRLIINYQ